MNVEHNLIMLFLKVLKIKQAQDFTLRFHVKISEIIAIEIAHYYTNDTNTISFFNPYFLCHTMKLLELNQFFICLIEKIYVLIKLQIATDNLILQFCMGQPSDFLYRLFFPVHCIFLMLLILLIVYCMVPIGTGQPCICCCLPLIS